MADTRVIFYTAHYHEPEARKLAAACGVFDVLIKPCEPEMVLRTVEAALGPTLAQPAVPIPVFDEFDREHLQLLTDKLSQKSDELRRTNERLEAIVQLGLKIGSERDQGRLLQFLCDASREIVGSRYALVGVQNGEEKSYRYFLTSGMDVSLAARVGRPAPLGNVLGSVIAAGRSFRAANRGDLNAVGVPASFPLFRALLASPILSPARVYGWICLLDKLGGEAFTEEDERLTGILAAQVGRIYENGSLYADLVQHASKLAEEASERKRGEEGLRLFRALIDHTIDGIEVIAPATGRFLDVNERLCVMHGYTREDLLKLSVPDISPLTGSKPWEELIAERRQAEIRMFESLHRRKDGSTFPVEVNLNFISLDREYVVAVVRDITERRQLEEKFRQSQKMEAVGRLAGGVAHDFNNLLTVINGYSELVHGGLPVADPKREMIREVITAGERAAALTRQLLAFSRKAVIEPRVLDLKSVVGEVERMLRRIVGEDIQLAVAADPEVWAVKADVGHLEQVILNLVVNSRDAMPKGGRITIEVRNCELDEVYAATHPDSRPGPHVLLAVADTGCGMDEETISRIFEPFFTTKGEYGTGLGLATVHGIVRQAGGHVAVYSEVGHGTTFKVYLPRVERDAIAFRPRRAGSHAEGR